MLRRLGFTGRLMAIVLFALIALWALGTGWAYMSRAAGEPPRALLPLPHQAKAIIDMLEANPERRDVLLAAVNSDTLSVAIMPAAPTVPPGVSRRPGIEWLVERYVNALGAREVIAFIDPPDTGACPGKSLSPDVDPGVEAGFPIGTCAKEPWWRGVGLGQYGLFARQPLHLAVSLKSGGYVVFETRGELVQRLFGLPPGFWVGALGALVAVAAILAIMREARPLRELGRAVARFGAAATPVEVAPRGAPEIRALIAAVNDMQARIAALVKGRTVLVAGLSHDLKTYITRLRLRAETIPDAAQRDRAVRDLDDMTRLVDDTLVVVRGATGLNGVEILDLGQLIAAERADRLNAALDVVRAPGAPPVMVSGNPLTLRRLFTNLIDNALRYGKTCRITVTGEGRTATVLVDDDGPGIPPAERMNVFEPFHRLEPSRNRATGGSGLGLAIAKQVVEAHGGSIAVEVSPANGARIRVALPMA